MLSDLHKITQISMGWTNSHLHQFIKDGKFYGPPPKDDWGGARTIDYRKIRLYEMLKKEKQQITYEYDFGDSWRHTVHLEGILPADNETTPPVWTGGERSCPPEDCGGPWGYQNMLQILEDPDHPDYKMQRDWLGDQFDPEEFDKKDVNKLLQSENYGVFEMF